MAAFTGVPMPSRLRARAPAAHRAPGPAMCARAGAPAQVLSRRALLAACAAAAAGAGVRRAGAYSSPYRPGNDDAVNAREPEPRRYDAADVVTTASGLRYFDLAPGAGGAARPGDAVTCNYTSRLAGLNGVKLDSSYERDAPFRCVVGDARLVPGFSEALVGMRVGGKRRAVIPPGIGYRNADMEPAVTSFFARRRLLSVLDTARDATIVVDIEVTRVR